MPRPWLHPPGVGSSRPTISRPSSSAVAPRSGPASSVRSWNRLTILFYSSIISTAAAADASVKHKRRQKWDAAIAEIENSLHNTAEPPSAQLPSLHDAEAWARGQSFPRVHSSTPHTDSMRDTTVPALPSESSKTDGGSRSSLYSQSITEATRRCLDTANLINSKVHELGKVSRTSIYANRVRSSSKSQPWVPKKVVRAEYSVAKLATGFLIQAGESESANSVQLEHLQDTLADMTQRLELIKTADAFDLEGSQRLEYPHFEITNEPTKIAALKLNTTLERTIRSYANGRIEYVQMLRRVARSLMTSPAAPDNATYSLLISRFVRLNHLRLVDMVITSMTEVCIRPDEKTVTAVLSYYIRRGDFERFQKYVGKIQGLHNGLMLARPDLPLNGIGSSRLIPKSKKLVQAMTVDASIVIAIVRGYLVFDREDTAKQMYDSFLRQGITPDARILASFLRYYALHGLWEQGWAVWKEASERGFTSPSSDNSSPEIRNQLYYAALQLCKSCEKLEEFRTIHEEGLSRGVPPDIQLRAPLKHRGFSTEEVNARRRASAIDVLQYRVATLIKDNTRWTLQVLVSGMILMDFTLSDVEAAFRRYGEDATYADWLESRPWLWNRKGVRVASDSPPKKLLTLDTELPRPLSDASPVAPAPEISQRDERYKEAPSNHSLSYWSDVRSPAIAG